MAKSKINKTSTVENKSSISLPDWMNINVMRAIVFGVAFLLYANTLSHDFTQDDAIVITDNMYTTQGIKGIPSILEYDTFHGFFKEEGKSKLVSGGRYRPFSLVVFAILYEFFGNHPFGFHLFTVLMFALCGLVLFNVLFQLLKKRFEAENALFLSFIASLLFVCHPIHTEVVANVKGVDEIFALLGSLLTLSFLIKYRTVPKLVYLLSASGIFLLSLLSKENAITYLAIILLVFFVFYNEKLSNSIKFVWPLFVATLVFLVLRTKAIGMGFGDAPMELMNNPFLKLSGNQYVPFSSAEKLATIFFTLGLYIKLLIFPHPLTHDYYPRHIEIMNFSSIWVILSILVYIGLAIYAIKNLKNRSLVSFCILYFLITLSIVSNLLFPIGTNMSERFMFMPSVGFCLLVAYGIFQFYQRKKPISKANMATVFNKMLFVTSIICVLYSAKTFSRNTIWKDNYTLFTTDVKTSVNSAKLQNSVGGELIARATSLKDSLERIRLVDEAITHLNKAIAIHPTYHNAYLLLGNAYFMKNEFDTAIKEYQQCLNLNPGYKDAIKNLQLVNREAGKYYGEKKHDLVNAFKYLNVAYEMNPQDYDTNRLLGVAYGVSGQAQKASEFFTNASKIKPCKESFNNLSIAYYNLGDKANGDKYAELSKSAAEN